jgi:hypothetical protein
MRLFRQQRPDGWSSVFEAIAGNLRARRSTIFIKVLFSNNTFALLSRATYCG